ncbi:MAG: HD-GYP domain-containing protein [Candidatus Magnetoovum sp. WYHC-5]|nr:HD-GYP domain-containing protein [Candidatus Magnetoovum sp. WYHC-5]
MRRKIPISKLTIGMYLDGIDESWIKTPFITHRFIIKNNEQIAKLKELGVKYIHIDTEKGKDTTYKEIQPEMDNMHFLKTEDIVVQMPKSRDMEEVVFFKKESKQNAAAKYTQENLKVYYEELNHYTQIDRHTLIQGTIIDFSLYIKNNLLIEHIVEYDNRDIELTGGMLSREGDFHIKREDNYKYIHYLKEIVRLKSLNGGEQLQQLKNAVIRENSKLLMQELFLDPRSGEKIKECKTSVENIVDTIQRNGNVVSNLITINKYDYYTYTHSVNVSVLSVGIGINLGLDKDELYILGIGSMLHDIGKCKIPNFILNKPTRLTEKEYSVIKQHVLLGKKILIEHYNFPSEAVYPVIEHHEKLTGQGYPNGLKRDEIHLIGRITGIADAYDALTTARPYKKALSPFESLSILRNQIEDFDEFIFYKFVKMLSN